LLKPIIQFTASRLIQLMPQQWMLQHESEELLLLDLIIWQ